MTEMQTVSCPKGMQISAYLRRLGKTVTTPCGGRGNCGKCIVRVIKGELKVSAMDRVHFSGEALRQGYRLACQAMPACEVTVEYQAYHAGE